MKSLSLLAGRTVATYLRKQQVNVRDIHDFIQILTHIWGRAERNSHNSSIYNFELWPFGLREKWFLTIDHYYIFQRSLTLHACVRERERERGRERERCGHTVACNHKSCDGIRRIFHMWLYITNSVIDICEDGVLIHHICNNLVPIFHKCEHLVPIFHMCEKLVPILHICVNWVPILHIWEKASQFFTD